MTIREYSITDIFTYILNKSLTIQIKAAFLITVFSLNTIVGFACAIGINMGFNSSHHQSGELKGIHGHAHSNGKSHLHDKGPKEESAAIVNHSSSANEKDNCCNNKVIKFNEIDKSASHSLSILINTFYNLTFTVVTYNYNILYTSNFTYTRYFVRNYHPPIPDIRIQIQSFQI